MASDRAFAIVLAAGAGRRVGAPEPKAFLEIGGRPILAVAVGAAAACPRVDGIVVTAPPEWEGRARSILTGCAVSVTVVTGGRSRQDSVRAALDELPAEAAVVAIHDAARPFAPPDLFTSAIDAVGPTSPGVVPVVPVTDTVKEVVGGRVVSTVPRDRLALAQTPQAFDVDALRAAHREAEAAGTVLTDDASALERVGAVVTTVAGDAGNLKITTLLDLANADARMGGLDG